MVNDTVSVIVPVYNVELYLRKCVDSILAQTYANLEIILVDDGSPDNCGAICDEYAQKDRRVKVIHKPNGGVSSARNAGLDAASGEYITFVDADDYIPENYFEALYKKMTDEVDMVICNADVILPTGEKRSRKFYGNLNSTVALDPYTTENGVNHTVWNVLFKRIIIGDLRFNTDIYLSEDMLFYCSALKKCRKVKYTTSTAYCYVIRPGSATNRQFSEKRYTEIYAWQNIFRLYEDNTEFRGMLEVDYVYHCHKLLNKIRDDGVHDAEKIKFFKREIRRLLPRGLKGNGKLRYKMELIADAFLDEKSIFLLKKLYRRLKRKTV